MRSCGAVPARSIVARYALSFSTYARPSSMACTVTTGIEMRPVGSSAAVNVVTATIAPKASSIRMGHLRV